MKMKNNLYKSFTIVIAVFFILNSVCIVPSIGNMTVDAKADGNENAVYKTEQFDDYIEYTEKYSKFSKNVSDIELKLSEASAVDTEISYVNSDGLSNVIKWEKGTGKISFSFECSQNALYTVKLKYKSLDENISEIGFGIKLDDKYPYEAFKDVSFPSFWKNESEDFSLDHAGNELTPKQIIADGFCERYAQDKSGIITEPYRLYLSKGKHTLTIQGKEYGVMLAAITLKSGGELPAYSDTVDKSKLNSFDAETIVIQGEHPIRKSSRSLLPMADTLDSRMTPCSSSKTLLNYIGGSSWQYTGDTLVYDFSVEQSGYYKIGMCFKQSVNMNRNSYRKLAIDGEVPFKEAESIAFGYSTSWEFETLGSKQDGDYLIWLDKGKHTVSFEVTLGEIEAGFCRRMNEISDNLNALYLEIIKITGATPDLNRDYELFKQIPGFNDTLKKNSESLLNLISDMEAKSGSSEIVASLKNMRRVLNKMVSSPYRAHDYVSSYYSAYSQISSWLFDMKKMPLAVDEIQIAPSDKSFDTKKNNIFKNAQYRLVRFLSSFTSDYNSISDSRDSDDALLLWVTWGKEQASALDVMIKNDFTAKTGIKVNLKIVGASLVNGLISGKYPDMLLNVSRTEPVNLGMRDALYNLKNFDDYEQVLTRFQEGAEVPFLYKNECYALPDTAQFYVMMYRKDILKSLGVGVPKNWEEFRNVAALVQRNNMEVYIPYTQITTNVSVVQGIGIMNLFPTMLKQAGLSLYSEDKRSTALKDDEVIDIFEQWTKMYTDYQFVKESDFYNRFRMGIMPIGIVPYSTYFTIKEMAPEVQGKWSVALVPGNGDNRTITGGGSGCSIVKRSNKKEKAWEFLKWWTSADAQFEYSNRVESLLGLVGRIPTSNVEAFKRMEWDKGQLKILLEQWSKVEELEEIPGSYYMIRSIDQAFWSVINGEMNPRDGLSYWSASADDEIQRKYKEYGG